MSLHRYLYVYSNPTGYVDPTGHFGVLKRLTDDMREAGEIAREEYQKSGGGAKDVVAGTAAKSLGGIIGTANTASDILLVDAAMVSGGVEGLENTGWDEKRSRE